MHKHTCDRVCNKAINIVGIYKHHSHQTLQLWLLTIPFLYREYGNADIKEIKLMARGRKKYETVGTLHFASVR